MLDKQQFWAMAQNGHRTAVVERNLIGGACPNIACLPSKNLIYSAEVAELARRGAEFGLLTKAWAAEYGPNGVRVNAVSPGAARTEGAEPMSEALDQLAAQAPAGRPATPDEIVEAIVFLATDRSSFIYGVRLAVDGWRAHRHLKNAKLAEYGCGWSSRTNHV